MLSAFLSHLTRGDILAAFALVVVVAAAWCFPLFGDGLFNRAEKAATHFARRKGWAVVLLATFPLAVRLAMLPWLPAPVPLVQDEFSYLLAADTFVHERLTNPPHPMWIFLDTYLVNQHPTYMSKYPPAQGAVLAVGQVLGHPWIGVLLSGAALAAVTLWALRGWLPPEWAFLGTALLLLRLELFSYWMNSYWGGAVPAIGGALVVGALPRIWHRRRARDAVILGLGTALLANSRPFEGLILCAPVFAGLLVWLSSKKRPPWNIALLRLMLPLGAVLTLCSIFVGYYNWRGTGNPLLFPYVVNVREYESAPYFTWQKLGPPLHYLNPQFEFAYNVWERDYWAQNRVTDVPTAAKHVGSMVLKFIHFFLWPELCVPLMALPWVLRDRRTRFLSAEAAVCFAGACSVLWFLPHYAAPAISTVFALLTQGMRHLRQWKFNARPVGIGLSRAVVLMAIVLAPFHQHNGTIDPPDPIVGQRAELAAQLASLSGDHLVIVRYSHPSEKEWVNNGADIDNAKVVWAREIPGVDIRPLLDYFRGRHVWLVEPDVAPPRLSPYPAVP